MKIINQFMSLLLSAALLTQGIPFAYAQNASDEEKLAPTEVLKADNGCSTQPVNGTCCSTMELVGNSCVLKAPLDTSLTDCNSISDCTSGKGCLPQTSKDIFSNITNEKERLNKQLELEAFLGNRANGSFCKTNLDCASYNCGPEAGKMTLKAESVCQEKLVCRSLHEGEALVGGVKCGLGLEPENGVCVKRYEPIVPVGEFDPEGKEIFKVYQEKACDMEFNDELKQAGLIAIKAIRGMEWYFGTMDTATPECTSGAPKQLRALGEGFQNARKPLLVNLSTSLNNIDADFKKLMEASWKYGKFEVVSGNEKVEEKFVDVHTDTPEYALENISDKDLATRQSSGIDTLIMMQRRNETFMAYEQGMLGVLQSFAGKITQAGQIATTLGGCSNGKPQYKVRPFLTWQKKNWNGMDQWYMQYDVKSGGDAVNKPEVAEALALLSGQQVSEGQGAKVSAPAAFTGQHYLIDPIPFSGLGLSGSTKVLKRRSGLLGLPIFGGFEDLRKAKYLSSYAYEPLNGALLGFYKKLKSGEKFIYEPELQTPDNKFTVDEKGHPIKRPIVLGRDCIENPNQIQYRFIRSGDKIEYPQVKLLLKEELRDFVDNLSKYEFDHFLKKGEEIDVQKIEVCADFKNFVKKVQGEGFAQFLAYGHSSKETYNLNSGDNFRRKLFSKLMVDFNNLKIYYENLVKVRKEQMACIDRVIETLGSLKILEPEDEKGITPGDSQNYGDNGANTSNKFTNLNSDLNNKRINPSGSKFKLNPFRPQFRSGNLKTINDRTNMDNLGEFRNFGGSGSISNSDGSSFAILKDKLKQNYDKAKSEGIDVDGKQKDYKKLVSDLYNNGAGPGLAGTNGQSGQSSLAKFGAPNLGAAKLGGDLKSAGSFGPTGEGYKGLHEETQSAGAAGGGKGGISSGGIGNGSYSGSYGLDNSASGSGGSGTQDNSLGSNDPSGMSDDQKKAMFDEYERNKKEYQGNEDDTLFKTVSKAYVRNLEKILKKKKVENNP